MCDLKVTLWREVFSMGAASTEVWGKKAVTLSDTHKNRVNRE